MRHRRQTGLLERLADGLLRSVTDARLDQIANQELLQIGSRQREAARDEQFGQPRATKACLLAWVSDGSGRLRHSQVASAPRPVLGLVGQAQIALQVGQEARNHAARAIDIDLAAFRRLQAGIQASGHRDRGAAA
jgi:hypothetical protein